MGRGLGLCPNFWECFDEQVLDVYNGVGTFCVYHHKMLVLVEWTPLILRLVHDPYNVIGEH